MERLTLEELKAKKESVIQENLEAIKGGDVEWCHILSQFEKFWQF
jgi:hypothetical protein